VNLPEWQPGPYETGRIVQRFGMIWQARCDIFGPHPPYTNGESPGPDDCHHLWQPLGAVAHVEAMEAALRVINMEYGDCDCTVPGCTQCLLRVALAPFDQTGSLE
jgi:hypothetical protein